MRCNHTHIKNLSIAPAFLKLHLIFTILVCAISQAYADTSQEVLLPGDVINAHAKYEKDCGNCHKKFDKAAQPGLCTYCHKDIAQDMLNRHGLHGQHDEKQPCSKCHVEHQGRDAHLTRLDTIGFEHAKQTGFELKGGHLSRKVLCRNCHLPHKKYRQVPTTCSGCHLKNDKHKGALGAECQNCHEEKNWKTIHFDHGKTHFQVLGKHVALKCKACHLDVHFKNTPKLCIECHRKDDKHKGNFGPKCETCHTDRGWKEILFDHNKATKYPLLGKHHEVKCISCHKGNPYKQKLKTDCYSCHRRDDKHKGQEGKKCETCHREKSWKKSEFDHRLSRFALVGGHLLVACKKCHSTYKFKEAPSDCWSCHEKKDVHKRRLGTGCESCHNTRNWKDWDFNHDKTGFRLQGKHRYLGCIECHRASVKKKIVLAASCVSCHGMDDKHNGSFGEQCKHCHSEISWKDIKVGSIRITGRGWLK